MIIFYRMKKLFLSLITFICILSLTSVSNARTNKAVIDEALGFMIGGDGGWSSFAIDYEIDDCVITYTQNFMGSTLLATYDFNKALWNSAASEIGEDGVEYFVLNGETGVQEVYLYSEDGEDISDGLWMFGISPGPSETIIFPILVEISRFENAMFDLMDECEGKKSKY